MSEKIGVGLGQAVDEAAVADNLRGSLRVGDYICLGSICVRFDDYGGCKERGIADWLRDVRLRRIRERCVLVRIPDRELPLRGTRTFSDGTRGTETRRSKFR